MKTLGFLLGILIVSGTLAQTTIPTQRKLSFWEKVTALFKATDSYLYGDIDSYGLSLRSIGKRSRFSWYGLRNKLRSEVKHSPCHDFSCPTYYEDFQKITHARSANAVEVKWLVDMPISFAKRWELIENAQSTLYILTWGVYDDVTGTTMAEKILERLQAVPNLDVRIIVDQKIAMLEKHQAVLDRLEKDSAGKVKIIRWQSTRYRIHANHRKLMVVDGEHVMLGGTNYGDNYSHLAGDAPWRDADVYLRGLSVGSQAQAQFAEVWNDQIIDNPASKSMTKLEVTPIDVDGTIPVQLLEHNPGNKARKVDHNIVSAVYKLMANAKNTIDIENAYYILDPILRDALKKAIKRGVKIRLLTNSQTSIDVPFLGSFVASSAKKTLSYGADVYLKKGTTLHAKYLIVDDEISMMGSHNLHPRSQAIDGENVVVVYEKKLALELKEHFESGLAEAFHPLREKDISVEKGLIDLIYGTLLFDHL